MMAEPIRALRLSFKIIMSLDGDMTPLALFPHPSFIGQIKGDVLCKTTHSTVPNKLGKFHDGVVYLIAHIIHIMGSWVTVSSSMDW